MQIAGTDIELIIAANFAILAIYSIVAGYHRRYLRAVFWLSAAVAATTTAPGLEWARPAHRLALGLAGPTFVHLNLAASITRRQAWTTYAPNLALATVAAVFPNNIVLSGLVGISLGLSYVEWVVFSPSRTAAVARATVLLPFVILTLYQNARAVIGSFDPEFGRLQVLPALAVIPLLLPTHD